MVNSTLQKSTKIKAINATAHNHANGTAHCWPTKFQTNCYIFCACDTKIRYRALVSLGLGWATPTSWVRNASRKRKNALSTWNFVLCSSITSQPFLATPFTHIHDICSCIHPLKLCSSILLASIIACQFPKSFGTPFEENSPRP